jgi:predicted small secreted protein
MAGLFLLVIAVSACSTLAGIGQDVQNAGLDFKHAFERE